MLASSYGHREIAQLLVDQGADVNIQEKVRDWKFLQLVLQLLPLDRAQCAGWSSNYFILFVCHGCSAQLIASVYRRQPIQ